MLCFYIFTFIFPIEGGEEIDVGGGYNGGEKSK